MPQAHQASPFAKRSENPKRQSIAYFSMEIALERNIPTYSGGLG